MPFLQTRKQRAAALVIALGVAIVAALLPFAAGLLGAAVLYVICAPAHRQLSRHVPPRLSALLVVSVALVLILLPGASLLGLVLNEAPETVRGMQEGQLFQRLSHLQVAGVELGAQIAAAGGSIVSWVSAQALTFFGSAARGALALVIAFFGVYYLLVSPDAVWPPVRDFLPFSDRNTERLRVRFLRVTEATLVGTLLTALVQGTMVGAGFWAVGLPDAVFWGFMTALASVLPLMGSALIWLPGVVVLVADGRFLEAAGLLAVGVAAGAADNFVRLFVYRAVSNIHPMATLVGAFAGLKYFGILGVLLGPLAIAYFFELLRMYHEEYGTPAPDEEPAPAAALEDQPTEMVVAEA
jgi:predicted PurR-regulated permease PerM